MSRATRKKGEPSYKQVAEEDIKDLITHEENVFNKADNKFKLQKKLSKQRGEENINEDDEEDEDIDFLDAEENDNNFATEKLQRVYRQLMKNKIKVDNVFDIQWDEKTKLADLDWQSSANFLDTISKVWGIKVEKTHKDTYRILGDLIRSQIQDPESEKESKFKDNFDLSKAMSKAILQRSNKSTDSYGIKTLEKNPESLDVIQYDIEFDVDPLFKKTSAKFDEQGASGLLINNLFMDENMMLLLESNQPSDKAAENKEKKEMKNQQNLSSNLSQECSNYWRLIDTKTLFSQKSAIAERLSNFKKMIQSTEKEQNSDIHLANEVISSKRQPFELFLIEQIIKTGTFIQNSKRQNNSIQSTLTRDEPVAIHEIDEFRMEDQIDEPYLQINPSIKTKRKNSLDDFVIQEEEDSKEIQNRKEDFIDAMEEEDDEEEIFELKQEKKDQEKHQQNIQEEDEEEMKLKLHEQDEDVQGKVILFSEAKDKNASDDENEEAGGKESDEEEEVEEEEDEEGNVIKTKKIKGLLDFDGIDEKLRTVGRGAHKKFKQQNTDENSNLEKGKQEKQKKLKKQKGEEEEKKFFDFDLDEVENADSVLCKPQSKKKTIKEYVKDAKFIFEEEDHEFLNEKEFQKVLEFISLPFTFTEMAKENTQVKDNNLPLEIPDFLPNQDEDSLDINNQFKNTFALNYGDDEDDEEKFKEQKNSVTIRDLKRKLWNNLRSRIMEKHQVQQKQKVPRKKQEEVEQIQFTQVFNELPYLFGESGRRVSMQSCFITILHLANEQTLKLSNFEGEDFGITKESKSDILEELKRQQEIEEEQERKDHAKEEIIIQEESQSPSKDHSLVSSLKKQDILKSIQKDKTGTASGKKSAAQVIDVDDEQEEEEKEMQLE